MIRPTQPDDVPALITMSAEAGMFRDNEIESLHDVFDNFFEGIAEIGAECFSLLEGPEVLGFIYFAPDTMAHGTWDIWWIVVRGDRKGQGLGRKLLQFAEERIRSAAGRVIFVDTSSLPFYEPTRQFYLRNGYEQEAVLRDYYAPGDGKAVFRKIL